MAKHRLYEECIDRAVYATDRGSFRTAEGRMVGRVFRRIEVGDYWELDSDAPLAGWERELMGVAAAVSEARRARGLA